MFFHQVHAVNDFNHVDQIDLIEHFAVNSQLRVAVGAADLGGAALAGFPLAGIHFFMTPAHNQLNGLHFAGIVTLNGAGETQLDAVNGGLAHLLE